MLNFEYYIPERIPSNIRQISSLNITSDGKIDGISVFLGELLYYKMDNSYYLVKDYGFCYTDGSQFYLDRLEEGSDEYQYVTAHVNIKNVRNRPELDTDNTEGMEVKKPKKTKKTKKAGARNKHIFDEYTTDVMNKMLVGFDTKEYTLDNKEKVRYDIVYVDPMYLKKFLGETFIKFVNMMDTGEPPVIRILYKNEPTYIQYMEYIKPDKKKIANDETNENASRIVFRLSADDEFKKFCLNDNNEYMKTIMKARHEYKQIVKKRLKEKYKVKFIVGREYTVNVCGNKNIRRTYMLKKFIYCVEDNPMNIVIMKQTDGPEPQTRFTLNPTECAFYHIKYESGLEILPMDWGWHLKK